MLGMSTTTLWFCLLACVFVCWYPCIYACLTVGAYLSFEGKSVIDLPRAKNPESRLQTQYMITHGVYVLYALYCMHCAVLQLLDIGYRISEGAVYSIHCSPSPGYLDTRYYLTASSRDEKSAVGCTALHCMREMNFKKLKVKVLGRSYLQDSSWIAVESPLHGA